MRPWTPRSNGSRAGSAAAGAARRHAVADGYVAHRRSSCPDRARCSTRCSPTTSATAPPTRGRDRPVAGCSTSATAGAPALRPAPGAGRARHAAAFVVDGEVGAARAVGVLVGDGARSRRSAGRADGGTTSGPPSRSTSCCRCETVSTGPRTTSTPGVRRDRDAVRRAARTTWPPTPRPRAARPRPGHRLQLLVGTSNIVAATLGDVRRAGTRPGPVLIACCTRSGCDRPTRGSTPPAPSWGPPTCTPPPRTGRASAPSHLRDGVWDGADPPRGLGGPRPPGPLRRPDRRQPLRRPLVDRRRRPRHVPGQGYEGSRSCSRPTSPDRRAVGPLADRRDDLRVGGVACRDGRGAAFGRLSACRLRTCREEAACVLVELEDPSCCFVPMRARNEAGTCSGTVRFAMHRFAELPPELGPPARRRTSRSGPGCRRRRRSRAVPWPVR